MNKPALCLILLSLIAKAGNVNASMSSFTDQLDQESTQVAGWFSGQLADRLGFLVNAHTGGPAGALGLPNFEVAALGGFAQFKINGATLKDLNLGAYAPTGLGAQVPAIISVPYGRLRAHVGLPGLFMLHSPDVGVTVGGTSLSWEKTNFSMTDLGAEFRGNLLEEGLVTPLTLSVALTYDYLSGSLRAQDSYTQTAVVNGETFVMNFSKLGYESSFTDSSVGLRSLISRNLILLTPYVGGAMEIHQGSVNSKVVTEGSISQTSPPGSTVSYDRSLGGSASLPSGRYRALAGFAMHMGLFDVDCGAEYDLRLGDFAEHIGLTAGL